MKLTNELRLPLEFYNACKSDYVVEDGIYSTTTLLKDPKEIILNIRHADEVVEDCADLAYSVLGTATHYILSKNEEGDNDIKEERIYVDFPNGRISGQFDLFSVDKKMVSDFKITTIWKYMMGDIEDYKQQLLTYAYMLNKNGFECDKGRIIQIYRDYSKTKAKTTAGYPQKPVGTIMFDFTKKDFEEIELFIVNKLNEIEKYIEVPDDEIPPCSKKNRWATDDKFAVMKKGRKSALRLLNSMEDAENFIKEVGGDYIVERPAASRKCEEYCKCKDFCSFYKEIHTTY